jgi:hypothetical protein
MYFISYMIVFCIFILYYLKKNKNLIINDINEKELYKNKIKVITYNIQRLPIMIFRNNIDMEKIIKEYDLFFFQEDFTQIFKSRILYGLNCIIPGNNDLFNCKITDSGLSIYSKYKIKFKKFVEFENLEFTDNLANKGFIIFELNDIIMINTHLQAGGEKNKISLEQLQIIFKEVKKYEKVLIVGDFNINIKDILNIPPEYKKICTLIPTHWMKNSFFGFGSSIYNRNYKPYFFDGGFYKNINISNIDTHYYDKFTDHLAVSFEIIL